MISQPVYGKKIGSHAVTAFTKKEKNKNHLYLIEIKVIEVEKCEGLSKS